MLNDLYLDLDVLLFFFQDFVVTETPLTLTIVHDFNEKLMLCVGLRHRFDIINVETKQVSLLKNIVTYRVSLDFYFLATNYIVWPLIRFIFPERTSSEPI